MKINCPVSHSLTFFGCANQLLLQLSGQLPSDDRAGEGARGSRLFNLTFPFSFSHPFDVFHFICSAAVTREFSSSGSIKCCLKTQEAYWELLEIKIQAFYITLKVILSSQMFIINKLVLNTANFAGDSIQYCIATVNSYFPFLPPWKLCHTLYLSHPPSRLIPAQQFFVPFPQILGFELTDVIRDKVQAQAS